MGLECGWRHARKRWSWECEDFEKSQLRLEHGGRELSFCHWDESWSLTVERRSWIFRISTDRDLKHQKIHRELGWGWHSKNCISLLVSPWTEVKKLINCLYLIKKKKRRMKLSTTSVVFTPAGHVSTLHKQTKNSSSYWKGSLLVALDYGRQLYLLLQKSTHVNMATSAHNHLQMHLYTTIHLRTRVRTHIPNLSAWCLFFLFVCFVWVYAITWVHIYALAQSAEAVEYTDCISAEG